MALGLGLAWYIQKHSLENKIDSLQKTVDSQTETIVQLEQELKATQFEVQTVENGLVALEDFTSKQKEIRDDADQTKTNVLEAVTQSDENKSWWYSEVPTDLLDALMCN